MKYSRKESKKMHLSDLGIFIADSTMKDTFSLTETQFQIFTK